MKLLNLFIGRRSSLPSGALLLAVIALVSKTFIETRFAGGTAEPALKPLEASYQTESLKLYNFGFQNLFADLIWVELLQAAQHTPIPDQRVSWEFTQLDALTSLDPNFERAYGFGAIYLSIFRQDKLGAKSLLEKWVKREPVYWKSNYFLGHHLYFELGDKEAAAKYLLKAATLEGAPYYLSSLGIRLLEESEGLFQALKMSCDIYPNLSSADAKGRLAIRIRSIVFALQNSLWDQALADFRKQRGHDPENIAELAPYQNSKTREIAKASAKESFDSELDSLLQQHYKFHYSSTLRKVESDQTLRQLGLEPIGVHKAKEKPKS